MKKVILVVCALSVELKIVKEQIKKVSVKNIEIKYLLTGVGNYNSIYNLKHYIDLNGKPDFIVNFGVVGKNSDSSCDFFQAYRIYNGSNFKELIIPIYIKELGLKSLLSSEKVITNDKDLLGEEYVDMESYGINYITSKEKIPVIFIKKPFDIVGINSNGISLELLKTHLMEFNYESLIINIYSYIVNNNDINKINLYYFKTYFKFTFSEFEKFKKNYNKLIAYDMNFDTFFNENKKLNKKEFINKIELI